MFTQRESIEWIALRACVMTGQNNKCAMCKILLEDPEFTLHHIIPRIKGGEDELDNLIGLCDKCHDIAELKELNREEIINYYRKYSLNDYNKHYRPIRKSYFMPEIDNQMGYKYPEEIILKEKFIIPGGRRLKEEDVISPKPKLNDLPIAISIFITKDHDGMIINRPNKYELKYGMSLANIAKIFNVSKATIINWQKNDKKREWMKSILNNL